MGTSSAVLLAIVPWLQAPVVVPQGPPPPLVLVAGKAPLGTDWQLGDGGFPAARPAAARVGVADDAGEAVTTGGARVQCRAEGVKLTLPSGRELLFAPDGFLHLRGGEVLGQFGGGVELLLLDGSALRILRSGSHRAPIESVVLARGDRGTMLWNDQQRTRQDVEVRPWAGERLWCLGDGGALYQAIALGPLLTLQSRLLPKDLDPAPPAARIVLMVDAVLQSLEALGEARPKRFDRETTPELREVLEAAPTIFVADQHAPPLIGRDPLRFGLRRGFELQLQQQAAELRLELCHEQDKEPMLVWRLGYGAEVSYSIAMVRLDRPGTGFQRQSRPVKLPSLAASITARPERNELVAAHEVLRLLRQPAR